MSIISVNELITEKSLYVDSVSYIGRPRSNTAMYVTKKVDCLLDSLSSVSECLVFVEKGVNIPDIIADRHTFCISDNPQLQYANFVKELAVKQHNKELALGFTLMPGGYYLSNDAIIDDSAEIEPGCFIGYNVKIGKNVHVFSGAVIKNTEIGENVLINEHAIIGANGFTMTNDNNGNKIRIPTLGKVIIGDNAEIGANDNISRGSAGDTTIDEYVKIDALVHIGHDAHICKNVEITAGSVIGGFDEIGESSFIGINSTIKNRVKVGKSVTVGMGSTVIKPVKDNSTVVGNPAHYL